VPTSFGEMLDFLSACSNSEKNQLHETYLEELALLIKMQMATM
jgi:hypothetical protein